ncbi:MAG: hypothetical protein ACOC0D_04820 [Spirochaeta sp.]
MKKTVLLLFMIIAATHLSAQAAEDIETLLSKDSVTYSDAAYIMLGTADRIDSDASPEQAFQLLQELIPHFSGINGSDPVTTAEVSLIGNHVFQVSPGILARLTGSPRYAFRDARFRRILQSQVNPNDPVSGNSLIQLAGQYSTYVENGHPARM